MRSTSCKEIAQQVLDQCIAGKAPQTLPHALLEEPCSAALFGVLVEGLADRFEPSLCDAYARLFSQVAAYVSGGDAAQMVSRYEFVRRVRQVVGTPQRVLVLSRVTLGADVAVTSVVLAAAKQRFPKSKIQFAGPQKNYELFAGDAAIQHAPIDYPRGTLRERLATSDQLTALTDDPECLVLDPDSRFTQLGLLQICPDDRYRFFESRAYGADSDQSLPELTARWTEETLGVSGAKPFIALKAKQPPQQRIAVSLGVGANVAKRLPDPFEERLLSLLAKRGLPICIDKGAGGSEAERVTQAVERSGAKVNYWDGSFAGFAEIIAASSLYVGYDSAGQHVAAACGVPSITVFSGFPAPRMFERWRTWGPKANVIRVDDPDPEKTLKLVEQTLQGLKS
ncbi:MAG TPA: glycosyltransferase family 9 protein [Bryobacteraceae bacterium]|nr:glycosyltransferase family 9 protein [Bryobacteraceae bacterium]